MVQGAVARGVATVTLAKALRLLTDDNRRNTWNVDAVDREGGQAGVPQKRRKIEMPVHTCARRQPANKPLHRVRRFTGIFEVIEEDEATTGLADSKHLASRHHRVGHDVDEVGSVDGVKIPVGKGKTGGVHSTERNVTDAATRQTDACALEHWCREVNGHHLTAARILDGA